METRRPAMSRTRSMVLLGVTAVSCAAFPIACAKAPNPGPASGQETPKAAGTSALVDASTVDAAATDASAAADGSATLSLRDALLRQDWTAAKAALVALPQDTQKAPLYRYVAAKIAHGLSDPDAALIALTGLERDLPDLREHILELRAESAAVRGPYEVATEYWSQKKGARANLRAAAVFAKTNDAAGVSRAVANALSDPTRTAAQETEARALRLHVPQLATLDDARWLFIHAPGHTSAKDVEEVMTKETSGRLRKLVSDAEMRARMDAWSHQGKPDEAIRELDALQKTRTVSWSSLEFCKIRAQILYAARSRYADAATTYAACAALGGKDQAENLFYEARAYSRANKDDIAITKYADLARRFPRSPQATQAKQLRARLLTLNAHYTDAAKAWDDLPASDDRDRLRAIAHLLAGNARVAEGILSRSARGRGHSGSQALRLRELHALAMDFSGDHRGAIDAWKGILQEAPLSYPALVARERLLARNVAFDTGKNTSGSGVPPTTPDLRNVVLTPALAMFGELARLGLGDEAEDALASHESDVRRQPSERPFESLCSAYAVTGRAKRRFRLAGGAETDACRYPTPFAEIMQEASRDKPIPIAFSYGIMRTESAFDPLVHSPASAVGLMQLLPDTAQRVGEKAQLPAAPLEDARVNIFLGVRYLDDLAAELKAPLALVAAAYNAGPEAIERWLSHLRPPSDAPSKAPRAAPPMDTALFCELIPYGETRAYVFQVMESYAHYAYASGGELPRFSLNLPPL